MPLENYVELEEPRRGNIIIEPVAKQPIVEEPVIQQPEIKQPTLVPVDYNPFEVAASRIKKSVGEPKRQLQGPLSYMTNKFNEAIENDKKQETPLWAKEAIAGRGTLNALLGLNGEERHQLWPEKMVRSALSLPGEVASGKFAMPKPGQTLADFETENPEHAAKLIERLSDLTNLALTGGITSVAKSGGMAKNQLGIVPIGRAKEMPVISGKPADVLKQAVDNTPGASIDKDGHLILNVSRNQHPDQEMSESVRGGVFYLPKGSKDQKYYSGKNHNFAYGGAQKIEGETAYKNPLVVKGATGGKAPEAAYNQIMNDKKAYQNMRTEALQSSGGWLQGLSKDLKIERIQQFLEKYAPELSNRAEYILQNSTKGNQLPYALQEAAVASAARNAGYDGIVGYSVKRTDGKPFISEIFDVRENRYPSPVGDYSVHPQFLSSGGKEGTAITEAAKQAPTFYSAMSKSIDAIPQAKASGDQWLATLTNSKGVRPEELEYTGLKEFLAGKKNVTKQEIQEFVKGSKVELGENLNPTYNGQEKYYSKWQLPGADNYREITLNMPKPSWWYPNRKDAPSQAALDKMYKSSHWDEPNPLLHMRMNDRFMDDPNYKGPRKLEDKDFQRYKELGPLIYKAIDEGKDVKALMKEQNEIGALIEGRKESIGNEGKIKSLHIEEIQSDWHQQGRDKGYKGQNLTAEDRVIRDRIKNNKATEADYLAWENGIGAKFAKDTDSNLVPDAPFKKTWHELALKRAIREAAEKGYDRLSWTPGEAQAARYDLSKQIDSIAYNPNTGYFKALDKSGKDISTGPVPKEKLADTIGKEAADKLLKTEPNNVGIHSLQNADLKIGGEGMKGFYDQIIPKSLEKLGKEWGVKVKQGEISYGGNKYGNKYGWEKGDDGKYYITTPEGRTGQSYSTRQEAQHEMKSLMQDATKQPIFYIDIPPEMKKSVLEKGFPLFSAGVPVLVPVDHNPFENK